VRYPLSLATLGAVIPHRFRHGFPSPRKCPTSPRIGRPLTLVMVGRRRSWIARFAPPIFEVFRCPWLSPRNGSSDFPVPGEPGAGDRCPPARRHRCRPAVSAWLPSGLRRPSTGALRPTRRLSVSPAPSGPPFKGLSPSCRVGPPLSLRRDRSPASVEDRSLPDPFGPGGAGDSLSFSSQASGLF